ncbi:MAG: XdhC family protein [Acidobacteriota bacterium]
MEAQVEILQSLLKPAEPMVLATVVDVRGSSPAKPGFKILVPAGGATVGSAGGGGLEQNVVADARECLASGKPALRSYKLTESGTGMWCGGEVTVFFEPYLPPATVWIFGYGHVGREVSQLVASAGFRCVIAHDQDIAGLDVQKISWDTLSPFPEIGRSDFVLVLTMNHETDMKILVRLAETRPRYVGVIGSKRKGEKLVEELAKRGIDAAGLNLHVPVGLPIHAVTPREIAISIAAELIREKNG